MLDACSRTFRTYYTTETHVKNITAPEKESGLRKGTFSFRKYAVPQMIYLPHSNICV